LDRSRDADMSSTLGEVGLADDAESNRVRLREVLEVS
jgi:hypothetical protein